MKYLGCSYYPEDWGVDRVATDIKLMKAANMNMVRMGEFAWCKMERREGEYDFSLFRRSLDLLAADGIGALMCTPTATAPAWLTHNYPDTLVVDAAGHRATHGIRQQCCYNSKTFRAFSNKITDAMTKSLAGCGNIVAWQIDNELGQRLQGACCCDACQEDFRQYLRERYQTIDNLNHCWKNTFWSHDYSAWDEILLAFPECFWGKNPPVIHFNYAVSRALDSMRFYDKVLRDYMMEQVEIIRRNIPGAKITTNNPVGVLDLKAIYQDLDFTAGDFYWDNPKASVSAERLARYRSYKNKRFFIAETGLGYDYMASSTGQKPAKVDMWRSFAHGAESYLVFRWRPPLGGQEQTALCPLSPAGEPRRTYHVAQELFSQAAALRGELEGIKLPKAEVAILFDSDVEKAYLRHGYGSTINYDKVIGDVFAQFHARNIVADFVTPGDSLDGYKLLVLPSQRIAWAGLSREIERFVKAGGTVWAIAELNNADGNGNFTDAKCPERLTEVFGVALHTGASIPKAARTRLSGTLGGAAVETSFAGGWIADLESRGATEVLLRFADGYYQGQDAVTVNRFGEGRAYYQGVSDPGAELFGRMAQEVIEQAGIDYFRDCPPGVEIIDCGAAVFILNRNDAPVSFKYPAAGKALMGDFDPATKLVKVEALEVCVIKTNGEAS